MKKLIAPTLAVLTFTTILLLAWAGGHDYFDAEGAFVRGDSTALIFTAALIFSTLAFVLGKVVESEL